jgi:hypothetical protein
VMAASNSFIKTQVSKQRTQICERDICVGCISTTVHCTIFVNKEDLDAKALKS